MIIANVHLRPVKVITTLVPERRKPEEKETLELAKRRQAVYAGWAPGVSW